MPNLSKFRPNMVVLATAAVANAGSEELAQKMHISYDNYSFYSEAHPKLKPVENQYGRYFPCRSLSGAKRYS